jgi:hypothetical protein
MTLDLNDAATLARTLGIIECGMRYDPEQPTVFFRYGLPGGREATIYRMLFNARLCIGPPDWGTYDEGYCYENVATALVCTVAWIDEGAIGEPEGWLKNLQTGEFRDHPESPA